MDNATMYIAADQLKTLHLVWQESAESAPVDWPLAVKPLSDPNAPSSATIASTPNVLYVNDSRTVKFTGSQLNNLISFASVKYDGGDGATKGITGSYSKNTLSLLIPSTITLKPGTKEFAVTLNKKDPKTNNSTTVVVTVSVLVAER